MNATKFLSERAASHEGIQRIWTLLESGVSPVVRLRPRKGKDSRLMKVTDGDSSTFYGVFTDDSMGAGDKSLHLPYTSILNGTIIVEVVTEL